MAVDDFANTRFYTASLLKILQYSVLEAREGVEALELLKENRGVERCKVVNNTPVTMSGRRAAFSGRVVQGILWRE